MVAFSMLLTTFAFYFYQLFFTENVLVDKEARTFRIYEGATFKAVQDSLYDQDIVQDLVAFSFVAKLMDYDKAVKPGLYEISPDMTNRSLVTLLRSGQQQPLNITFNNVRTKRDLAEKITKNLMIKPEQFEALLLDTAYIEKFGFKPETVMSMFIPNTYQVYWTTSAEELFDRMHTEYKRFWTEEKLAKAAALKLSPVEVSTLASIVQAESVKSDERPRIAGVYTNRLKRGIPLQADPTLVFALNDFSIKRVLNVHKEIDSPYNTYKYRGLPPGPINLPDISAINAVLDAEQHNYLYFCAKEDFSGYHRFATNLAEHNRNARIYQQALNRARVYK